MKPVSFPEQNLVLNAPKDWDEKRQGPCGGLPVHRCHDGRIISVWHLSLKEFFHIIFSRKIVLTVLSASGTQPPVSLGVKEVFRKATNA
jgi:hypothetical protein